MQRRAFILGGLAALMTRPRLSDANIALIPRQLCLYHTHTQECLEITYWRNNNLMQSSLNRLNHFLRDYRTDQITSIDPQLVDILFDMQLHSGNHDGVFEIISGYRSPETNYLLRREHCGVARHSLHQEGKALDIRLRGTPLSQVHTLAVNMRRGGVGYYPRSDFVHIDTGDVRYW
jgi:uncharacterized protein YcbK (DUF882 family)